MRGSITKLPSVRAKRLGLIFSAWTDIVFNVIKFLLVFVSFNNFNLLSSKEIEKLIKLKSNDEDSI